MNTVVNALRTHLVNPEPTKVARPDWTASYLRREFTVPEGTDAATLWATACGVYRITIDGTPVTERLFTPGFTNYYHRLQYQRFDVSALLTPGTHTIGIELGNGWYRGWSGCTGGMGLSFPIFGKELKISAVLELVTGGTADIFPLTDGTIRATQDGPIRFNDMRGGETYDAGREMLGWQHNGFDDSRWHGTAPASYDGALVVDESLPILEHEVFTPQLLTTPNGERVLDFGQNFTGYVGFTLDAAAGTTVRLVHGETLDEHGDFTLENLMEGPNAGDEPFGQVITYTARGGVQQYQPAFTYMGFRYVLIEGFAAEVDPADFRGIAIYSDVTMNGEFECSDADINQFVSNTRWSLKSNVVDIPTDCPTREHSGWTGDAQVFAEAAHWLADAQPFWRRWLRDVALQQTKAGAISCIAPDAAPQMGKYINGSTGWGDAIEIIPMTMFRFTGDLDVIREFYPNVRRWVEYNRRRARRRVNPVNALRTGLHRRYILDTGYHWGEWLEPGAELKNAVPKNMFLPDAEVATAYLAYGAKIAAEMADLLGLDAEAQEHRDLHRKVAAAYRIEFLPDGFPAERARQARYVRPIAFDLVNDDHKRLLAQRLAEVVDEADGTLGTGFLSTGLILSALSEHGQLDAAYRLLENRKLPGWLYQVSRGATTIWENWDGIDEQGVPRASLNHYSKGAMVAWLFRDMCGIRIDEGHRLEIAPHPGGTLQWARARYRMSAGEVVSGWQKVDDGIRYRVSVPEGVTATVRLPGAEPVQAGAGDHEWTIAAAPAA